MYYRGEKVVLIDGSTDDSVNRSNVTLTHLDELIQIAMAADFNYRDSI